jgi:hypothetical protein
LRFDRWALRSALVLTAVLLSCVGDEPPASLGRLEQAMNTNGSVVPPAAFTPTGTQPNAQFGTSLALISQADGGGLIVVGAPGAMAGAGQVYVLRRQPDGSLGIVQYFDGPPVIVYAPHFGVTLAVADFNGDGHMDLAVGAPGYSDGGSPNEGAVFVYPGIPGDKPFGLPMHMVINPASGYLPGALFGTSVCVSPHWNGDTLPDLVIGAANLGTYVYPGIGTPAMISRDAGFELSGLGAVVAAADINGDGYTDTLVGDPQAGGGARQGEVMFNITTAGTTPVLNAFTAQVDGLFGAAITGLGEISGDQFEDVAIGEPGLNAGAGAVSLYFGTFSGLAHSQDLSWNGAISAQFGQALARVGDFEQQGLNELLVGAPGDFSLFPNSVGAAVLYDLSSVVGGTATKRLSFQGPNQAGAAFGAAVAGGVDLNGDGLGDIVIGAPGLTTDILTGSSAGGIFVYLGALAPFDAGTWADAGTSTDAGTPFDGGTPTDAGKVIDAGAPDAGSVDGGSSDGGAPDAGAHDGGSPDAGLPDAGTTADAGEGPDGGTGTPPDLNFTTCGCHADAGTVLLVLAPLVLRRRRFRQ